MNNSIEQFSQAITTAGLLAPESIHADGKIHRFSTNGKRGDESGWYMLHTDGLPAGAFGCWRSGLQSSWCAKSDTAMNPAEREAHRARIKAMQLQREAEQAQRHTSAATNAAQRWQSATACTVHPYLTAKGVQAHGVKVDSAGALIVPMRDAAGALHSLQTITAEGDKRFLSGGKVKGCYHAIGKPDGVLIVCEGYATGASIHEATGHAVAVAFNAGNLEVVAGALRAKYPALKIIIAADDDWQTEGNPGLTAAKQSALAVGGLVAVPMFPANRPDKATDFNDLHQLAGADAVRACIDRAQSVPLDKPDSLAECSDWPEPQALIAKIKLEPYPLHALPDAIRNAVAEVQAFTKAPAAMVTSCALSALSVALQAHNDVQRAERLSGPIGLFLLTIADSGERKSSCDGYFTAAIRDYQNQQTEQAKPLIQDYKAALAIWEAKHAGIKDKIKALAKDSKPTASHESDLRDLERSKPEPPRVPRLLYADATPEALAFSLGKGWPSGGIVSDEAGSVFGAHGMGRDSIMRNLALLNQLWDGKSLTIDRRSEGGSFMVKGARLTVALQVQEATLRSFFDQSKGLARGTGFLARFMVAWPESTQGYRPFTEGGSWSHLAAFNRRITAILNQAVPIQDDGSLAPQMLTLSPEAKTRWIAFHDGIEQQLRGGGDLYDVRDVASKSADNAARLAALFHLFDGGTGPVSTEAFDAASQIAAWHLHEARRFFGELALPPELANAARLDSWLIEYCRQERTHFVGKNHVRQHGPIRDGARLDAALRELAELGRLRLAKDGKRLTIQVNPAILDIATAIPAISATQQRQSAGTVARIATVAVANLPEPEEVEGAV